MARRRVGIWLIGAFGGVGSSVALGLAALKHRAIDSTGLVTALPFFDRLDLDFTDDFVVGGHEVRNSDFVTECAKLGGARPAYPRSLIDDCSNELSNWADNNVVQFAANSRIKDDFKSFCDKQRLDQLVVVNVASTEPQVVERTEHVHLDQLKKAIGRGDDSVLPVSSRYALAAIDAGFPYVNFTPSPGASLPSLIALAKEKGVPVAGNDGKTGETLIKSVLAPMFAARNLNVLSWVGHNLLGNRDGRSLMDKAVRASKLRSKDQAINSLLGEKPQTLTTIECVDSLDDWKTAWDHIHFQGFLGVNMSLQFTWHGCDSALAAPLVIDLARLTLLAQRRGESGPLPHLAAFFKSPLGIDEHDFSRQMNMLISYAQAACQ